MGGDTIWTNHIEAPISVGERQRGRLVPFGGSSGVSHSDQCSLVDRRACALVAKERAFMNMAPEYQIADLLKLLWSFGTPSPE
jgi:hypothetical protein